MGSRSNTVVEKYELKLFFLWFFVWFPCNNISLYVLGIAPANLHVLLFRVGSPLLTSNNFFSIYRISICVHTYIYRHTVIIALLYTFT
jgi:hypothetical protein